MRIETLVALALAFVASCDKPKPTHEVTPDGIELPWSTDHDAALAKLQGSWVVKAFGYPRYIAAWKFSGANVTVYDPENKTETPNVFVFRSPCSVRLKNGYGGTLVIDGDTVYLGLGYGGFKDGTTIVACQGAGTVYATPAGCKTYEKHFERRIIETTCSSRDGVFVSVEKTGTFAGEHESRFVGETVLLSKQLANNKIDRQPDWETAKAEADKAYATRSWRDQ